MAAQNPTHRIRQVSFDLRYAGAANALRQRKQMEEAFYRTILPLLEETFDRYAPADQLYQLARLEIDLGAINPERLDIECLRQTLRAQLDQILAVAPVSDMPAAFNSTLAATLLPTAATPVIDMPAAISSTLAATLLHFLTAGYWPWQASFNRMAQVETALLALAPSEAQHLAHQLRPLLQHASVRQRLVEQFTPAFLSWLLEQLQPEQAVGLELLTRTMLPDLPAQRWWVILLAAVSTFVPGQTISQEVLERRLHAERRQLHLPAPPGDASEWTEKRAQPVQPTGSPVALAQAALPIPEVSLPAGLYAPYAGMVLLHPFLERFFRRLDLVRENIPLATLDQRVRAVHLLYYLATGQEQPEEQETPLLKLFCGLPLAFPLVKTLALHPEERAEAEVLLTAVIEHWEKLKNSSPTALRETFLQRSGKLVTHDDQWHLVVEQQTVDILLDYLPWTISLVRLPWLNAPLWVDWA